MLYFDIGDKRFRTALEMSGPYDCQSSSFLLLVSK